MDLEQIKKDIIECNNNNALNNEAKIVRLKILQTAIEKLNHDKKYKDNMAKFIEDGQELTLLSDNVYQIEESIELNKISLKGYILESDLCKDLEEQGVENYTLNDLKIYLDKYKANGINMLEIEKAISLYENIENIESLENEGINSLARNLGDIFGKKLLSKYNETIETKNDGEIIINHISKTREQYENDQKKVLEKIDELYVSDGILDRNAKQYATEMVNQVFNYYKNGNKKIEFQIAKEKGSQEGFKY